MRGSIYVLVLAALLVGGCVKQKAPLVISIPEDIAMCGTIRFEGSCNADIDTLVTVGVTLIHHMTFDRAEELFQQVIDYDETCFWGYWGKAMTRIHPLWPDVPTEALMLEGQQLAAKALELASTAQERYYGEALSAYYAYPNQTEQYRLAQYHQGWQAVYETFPDDLEAKAFYSLSLIATAGTADDNLDQLLKAGALAEEVLKEEPEHPAGFHYVIHAYDHPALGQKAIEAARGYSDIAPEIPHALHMPTHIFTRLGLWDESVDWNRRSADAATKYKINDEISAHYLHAVDYLVYAYLQQGKDQEALNILDEVRSKAAHFQSHPAGAYSLAAIDARYAIERKDWESLSMLQPAIPAYYPWAEYPEYQALTHFAIALGAAKTGNLEKAQNELDQLSALQAKTDQISGREYWSFQVDIQREAIKAWMALVRGESRQALDLMKNSAEMESSVRLHGVTPGYLIPANELYGDMLLETGMYGEALIQYEYCLQSTPKKLNTVYGAGLAAQESGDYEKARNYFNQVLELTREGDERPMRRAAMEYLDNV